MKNWNEAFRTWADAFPGGRPAVARKLRVSASTVYYWRLGAYPRDKRRARVERVSGGKVGAHLPRYSESVSQSAQG